MHKCVVKSFYFVLSLLLLRALMAASMGMWSSGFHDQIGQWAFVMAGVFGHFGASAIEYAVELLYRGVSLAKAGKVRQEQ